MLIITFSYSYTKYFTDKHKNSYNLQEYKKRDNSKTKIIVIQLTNIHWSIKRDMLNKW